MREFSHTCKSLTVKCCARFRHNIYFSSESSGLAAVITGRPNARHPVPGETDTGLTAAAASRTIARPDLPAPSGPILPDALTRVLTSRARRRPTSGQARKWVISTHGGKRSGAPMRRPLSFSFEPFACGKDRNRLNARATRCRTPWGSACSRTLRRPALSLDQTVQKKKIQGRHSTKERGTWASEPTP